MLEEQQKHKMNRQKILILTTPFRPNIGGVETHLDDLITEGVWEGFSFTVLTYQPLITKASGKTFERGKNYEVIRIPWLKFNLFLKFEKYPILEFLYLFPGLFFAGIVYLFFKSKEVKKIHAQGLVAGVVGIVLGKLFNKKVIISTHSIYSFPKAGLYRGFARKVFLGAEAVLTLSNQSRKEILDLGADKRKVFLFTYWVNQKLFKPLNKTNLRKIYKINKNDFVCMFVGRLVEGKGISELLSAAKITPSVKFLIIGDGPLSENVQERQKNLDNLFFLGKVDNDKLAVFYNVADILIVPSTHEEGYGRVILEALSCGLPVIGSKRGGIKESLPKEAGLLIDITPKNIKNALLKLSSDKKILRKMSKYAIYIARIIYSGKNSKNILRFYE